MVRSFGVESRSFAVEGRSLTRPVAPDVVESWEDQDFSEWSSVGAGWSIQSSFVTDGDYGAEYSDSGGNTTVRSTGVDDLPQQGDRFVIDWTTSIGSDNASGVEWRLHWAYDGTDWYEIHHNMDESTLEFWLRGSSDTRHINDVADYDADTHYQTVVVWDDGATFGGSAGDFDIKVTDMDNGGSVVASGSASDNNLTDGEVRMQPNPTEQVTFQFDNWRITNP